MDNPTALQPLSSNTTEFIVIGVYFCFLIAVGIVFGRLVRNSSDYFRAGQSTVVSLGEPIAEGSLYEFQVKRRLGKMPEDLR